MNNSEIDAQIDALLDITDGSYAEAMCLVCLDISMKESKAIQKSIYRNRISSNKNCG